MSKWTWLYWAVEFEGETYVGAYQTDGSNVHGDVPSSRYDYTLISEVQFRALAIEQKQRVREARDADVDS